MEQEITITKKSKDNTSLWLSNNRTFIVDSMSVEEVKGWQEGDIISITKLPSDSPFSYRLKNKEVSVLAGVPND